MAEQRKNDDQKFNFRPKRRAKCLRTKRESSDSEEEKNEEDMSTLKMSSKRPAESKTDENPCKRTRTEKEVCAICKDPDSTEPFTFLTCAHSFHGTCITQWFERSVRCPICRTVVRESAAHSHDTDMYETDFSDTDESVFNYSDSFITSTSASASSSSSSSESESELNSDESLLQSDNNAQNSWLSSQLDDTNSETSTDDTTTLLYPCDSNWQSSPVSDETDWPPVVVSAEVNLRFPPLIDSSETDYSEEE